MSAILDAQLHRRGLERKGKEGGINFAGDSPIHPRNRPLRRRLFDSTVLFWIQFLTTTMSTAGTSLGSHAEADYGLTRTTSVVVFVLTYQLGRMAGSITLPPWSETFGRKPTFIACTLVYSIMTLIVGVVPHVAGAIVGRVVSGMMSAAGGSVAAGSVQDMYPTEARVWMIFFWTVVSTSGLAIGQIYGSYIAEYVGWRWGFYIVAIAMFVTSIVCLFLTESRPSRILAKEIEILNRSAAPGSPVLHSSMEAANPQLRAFLKNSLFRPLYFFFTEPLCTTVVTISAFAWSLLFLFTESLTVVFTLDGFTETRSSLFFIPILVGICFSVPVRVHDIRTLRRKKKEDTIKPEDKLFGFALGAPALAIGLWMFAWTTPQAVHVHWIVPSIALAIVGFAINEFEYVLSGYLTDSYGSFASSAVGSIATLRAAFAGSVPLFGYFMFTGISTNAASSILAAFATVFCIVPAVFMRYGERIRAKSRFARESVETMQ